MTFDAKAVAKRLAGKMDDEPSEYDDSEDSEEMESSPADALKDMYKAMKQGDYDAAYDAFKVAVQRCHDEE